MKPNRPPNDRSLKFHSVCRFLPALFLSFLTVSLSAEIVEFNNGELLQGELLKRDESFIILRTKEDTLVIKNEFIKSVHNDSELKRLEKEREDRAKSERVKETLKKELERAADRAEQAAKAAKQPGYTLPNTPGWMMGRSAILPGWGQKEAGIAAGNGLIGAGIAGGVAIVYLNDVVGRAHSEYEQKINENILLTLLPGSTGIGERLVTGYVLNDLAGRDCSLAVQNYNISRQVFGAFYAGQLIQLALRLGLPLARRSERPPFEITLSGSVPSDLPGSKQEVMIAFRFTID